MTGFDSKCLHLKADIDGTFTIELDFMGQGQWVAYTELEVQGGYTHHMFPAGLSAHWVRIVPRTDCTATAQFFYT
jgi:hypothetical protein